MSAFKRFGPGDQVDNVLILEPSWVLSSGSAGWRGSPEGSASVSLYGGYNRKPGGVVREYVFQRTIQGTDSFGKLTRGEPITASVNFVYMTKEERSITQRSNQRWGHEHWKTVEGLYDYYHRRDPDYTTASYDHYCMFFHSGSRNIIHVYDRSFTSGGPSRGQLYTAMPTASFTIESWIKPFTTSSVGNTFTIVSHNQGFQFYVDGTSGTLGLRSYSGSAAVVAYATGSPGAVCPGEWHHAAVTFDASTLSGTFWLNLQNIGTFTLPTTLKLPNSYTGSLNIGTMWSGNIDTQIEDYQDPASGGALGTGFHGFIGETRIWSTAKTWTALSATHNSRLTGSALESSTLLSCIRFDEGPLSTPSPSQVPNYPTWVIDEYNDGGLMGSGVIDYAAHSQGRVPDWGNMVHFDDRPGPGWHPNDNTRFYVGKNFAPTSISGNMRDAVAAGEIQRMLVISVPVGMFGRRIVPNTVAVRDRAFDDVSYGLTRTLIDDGRGGLFLSGSARLNPVGQAYATATYSVGTASITFQARTLGPSSNGYGITATVNGPPGSPNWGLNESDPYNMILTVPCQIDGFTPTGNFWGLYQLFASSSTYVRPTSVTAPSDNAGSPSFTLSGGTFGNPSLASSGSYRGVEWNKVGNVFYDEGLIVIKDPSLLDIGAPWTEASSDSNYLLDVSFHGESRIPVKTFMCRIDRGDLNASLNQTFWDEEEDGDRVRTRPDGEIYVSTVGLYNSDRELVGVARLAEPLRVRPRDKMNVKLRMDF